MADLLLLGDYALSALAVTGLADGRGWNWVSHETIAELPTLERVGRVPRLPKLTVQVHPLLGSSVAASLNGLESASERGDVLPLQLGNGYLFGWFVVESFDRTWQNTTADGTIIAATVNLSLRESRPPEQNASPQLGYAEFATPERTQPDAIDSSRDPSDVPLSEIVRM